MTPTEWLWLAFAIFGPLPLIWAYKRWKVERDARMVRRMMEERRRKFGGFVSTPGKKQPTRLRRPK